MTPLHQAAMLGHEGIVDLLLAAGAGLEALDTVSRFTERETLGAILEAGPSTFGVEGFFCFFLPALKPTVE